MEKNPIIAIRKADVIEAHKHFDNLMMHVEGILNQQAKIHVSMYQKMKPIELEKKSVETIKEACIDTPFDPENVILHSGFSFPDIVAESYYGVEVKSTNKNHWTSTGSSIVESTRIKNVDDIYMLFGKLGGEYAEFKCRPYQDVLYDIAVTHSPRYLINMNLEKGHTIFDKIGLSYDKLRTDPNAISFVKSYYKSIAESQHGQMPWWISTSDDEVEPISMNIHHWNSLSSLEKDELRSIILILFPEVVTGQYEKASMWLVNVKGVVNHCIRDTFSAGGKIRLIDGKKYTEGLPKIWGTLANNYNRVKNLLQEKSPILPYIKEFNPSLLQRTNMYDVWIKQVDRLLKTHTIGNKTYTIRESLERNLIEIT